MQYERLFTPITINGMHLRNRIMMPAMHHLYTENGHCTPRFTEYYRQRGEGGAGLIIVGSCRFDEYGAKDNSMSLADESTVAGWQEFTNIMHTTGAKVAVQLYHAGRYMPRKDVPCGKEALAPSQTYCVYTKETAPEMTKEQIREVLEKYAEGAARAKRAGFDAVEISASSGYLLNQFLSPVTNLRTDEYGGSWENRTRFPLEVIRTVREAVGPDYPLILRLGGHDLVKGSNTNEELSDFAVLAEDAGIDLFNVTAGWHESRVPQITGDLPAGGFTYLAEGIRKKVHVPVSAANRVNDPMVAEKAIAMGHCDMVTMGRALLADPQLPNKAAAGLERQIRPCMGCNQGCLANTFFDRPICCLVNAVCGRELELDLTPAAEPKNVLIVGGGPAGCEAALRAAQRGHHVTLLEKSDRIGGQIKLTAVTPARADFERLISYYESNLPAAGVDVRLNTDIFAETALPAAAFDVVISAAGGKGAPFTIPTDGSIPVITVEDMLTQRKIPGHNVVIIGSSFVAAQAAQYLAAESSLSPAQLYHLSIFKAETPEKIDKLLNSTSRNITVIDRLKKIGIGFESGVGWPCMSELSRLGVRKMPMSWIERIENGIVCGVSKDRDGNFTAFRMPADTVVFTPGAHRNEAPAQLLAQRFPQAQLYEIGNCLKAGRAIDAIRRGCELACSI